MESYIILYLLAFCRVWGFMMMMPQLGELELPTGTKFVIYASITPFMVAPESVQTSHLETDLSLMILIAKEFLVGTFLGFLISLPLRMPEMIGDFIDSQRGTAVSSQYNPDLGEESSALGTLLFLIMITYFYTEGGFESLIGFLSGSFIVQPIYGFEFTLGEDPYHLAINIVSHFLKIFAIVSFPIVAMLFLIDFSFGLTSKFAPSLNVYSITMPVKAIVGIGMLISVHPKMTQACISFFHQLGEQLS